MPRRTRLARHARQNAVAYLTLFVALGGTSAYAANTIASEDIIDESILSQDIRNGQVTRGDIAANAVNSSRVADGALTGAAIANNSLTGADIANDTLTDADIAESTLTGVRLTGLTSVRSVDETVAAGEQRFVAVACPTGQVVVSGGVYNSSVSTAVNLNSTHPTDGDSEFFGSTGYGGYVNNASQSGITINAIAVCANGDVAAPAVRSGAQRPPKG